MLGFCRQADGGVKLVVAKGGAVWWVLRFARACRWAGEVLVVLGDKKLLLLFKFEWDDTVGEKE